MSLTTYVASRRMIWTRIFVVAVGVYVVLGASPKWLADWAAELAELAGFVLLSVAAFGRLWCLLFIAGVKNEVLVTDGPFSVVRNPLYVFNFIGAVGLGLAVENPPLALLIGLVFAVFYPAVVRQEERHLAELHGQDFAAYLGRTPRWIPNLRLYREPAFILVSASKFRKGILDSAWFLWAFFFWEATEEFRQAGYLSTLF